MLVVRVWLPIERFSSGGSFTSVPKFAQQDLEYVGILQVSKTLFVNLQYWNWMELELLQAKRIFLHVQRFYFTLLSDLQSLCKYYTYSMVWSSSHCWNIHRKSWFDGPFLLLGWIRLDIPSLVAPEPDPGPISAAWADQRWEVSGAGWTWWNLVNPRAIYGATRGMEKSSIELCKKTLF